MASKPRAAIYARYSTEGQKESSIEDQFHVCTKLCEREGFRVTHRFHDQAISGGTAQRPGYQDMLEAARRRAFDVIVAEDPSRFWRNQAEQAPRLAELEDLGIRLVTCSGLDSREASFAMVAPLMGAFSEHARKEAGYRTRRGQEGKARTGGATGGRAYGYRVVKTGIGKEIEPTEAAVVKRIFEMRAAGQSPLAIARTLNAEGVPAPGAAWARKSGVLPVWRVSALSGSIPRGVGILNNPLYTGKVIWGRTKWVRSAADSKVRRPVATPPSEWITHDVPALRIIPDRVWDKVYSLQRESTPLREAVRKGVRMSPNKGHGNYWLSGLLVCDCCGSNLQIDGRVSYACPSHKAGRCKNGVRVRRVDVEAAVLALFRKELLDPARIRAEQRRVEAALKAEDKRAAASARAAVSPEAMRRVEADIAATRKLRISEAAKRAALAELERERQELIDAASRRAATPLTEARRLLAQLPAFAKSFERQLEDLLHGRLKDKEAIREATAATRQLIEGGCIRMLPRTGALEAQVRLVGLGGKALRVAGKTTRKVCVSGSGGRI
jgi:site-specific DNA recombinase